MSKKLISGYSHIDLFNFYSIKVLEKAGNYSPTQIEIDEIENLLKELFMVLKIRNEVKRSFKTISALRFLDCSN
jgi:hypothetical protein